VNLELENYGSAIRDCQAAVRMGGGQEKMDQKCLTKALFRLCKGFLALDKLDESRSALDYGKNVCN
jgi:hypothetical protein